MIQATGEPALYFPVVELGETCVWLPNETAIVYPNLRRERDALDPARTNTVYDGPYGGIKKLYGAKLIENVTQALARIVVTDIMLRVKQLTGYRPFMSTYDSHDYIVPWAEAPAFDAILERQFLVGPAWAEGLPLASEGGWGATLLEAERGVNQ
jgi:DNA polymerase